MTTFIFLLPVCLCDAGTRWGDTFLQLLIISAEILDK
jgi:hypothetical protein